jgi:hypothetical protein
MALLMMVPGSRKHSSLPAPLFKLLQQKSFNFRKMKKVLTIRLMSFSFLSIFNRIFFQEGGKPVKSIFSVSDAPDK